MSAESSKREGLAETQMIQQKCCFKSCEALGVPQEGFGFFACTPCLEELQRMCEEQFRRGAAARPKEEGGGK